MVERRSSGRVSHRAVALSSAAVLAVYAAGYQRTRQAADRFDTSRRAATTPQASEPSSSGVTATVRPAPADDVPAPRESDPLSSPVPQTATRTTNVPVRPDSGSAAGTLTPAPSPNPAVVSPAPASLATAPAPVPEPAAPATATAPEPPPVPETTAALPARDEPRYQDGTFLGWGSCRHGDIQAAVVIEGGRITATTIAQCLTRYSCKWIEGLLPQVVDRQSARLDVVSGATESTEAFEDAVLDALAKAK